ncbi:MAG: hypothetical protein L6Q92_14375 [Phycisphaerae bacterium]|nr:hypothetical protein [Phycisphaerae bacterium]
MVALARRSAFAFSMTAAVWLAGLVAAQPASAQDVLLHRQAPNRLNGVYADTYYLDDFGLPAASLVADRFLLAQSATAWRVVWHGFYGRSFEWLDPAPPSSETMRLQFYADAGGLPGELRYEEEFLNPPRVYTGFQVSGLPTRKEYRYDVTLSAGFPVAANTAYWLAISQVGEAIAFRWETSSGGELAVRFPPDAPWEVFQGTQLAYELRTPEQTSAMVVLFGATLMRLRRVRSRCSR